MSNTSDYFFPSEGASLYEAVVKRDYGGVLNSFVSASRKAISLFVDSSYHDAQQSRNHESYPYEEQKLDEFHETTDDTQTSFKRFDNERKCCPLIFSQFNSDDDEDNEDNHFLTNPSYHDILIEELRAIEITNYEGHLEKYDTKTMSENNGKWGDEEISDENAADVKEPSKTRRWKSRKYKRNQYKGISTNRVGEEKMMQFAANWIVNSRPPPTFVVYSTDVKKKDVGKSDDTINEAHTTNNDRTNENNANIPPVFDGSVGANSGSLLHLACIVDDPFLLAVFVVMGADQGSKHSAFRRLPIHEAACSNSTDCLSLLLEMSKDESSMFSLFCSSHAHKPINPFSDVLKSQSAVQPPPQSTIDSPFLFSLQTIRSLIVSIHNNACSPAEAARQLLATCWAGAVRQTNPPLYALTDGHGNTALHWAAFRDCVPCISLLLQAGADPNAPALSTGWTPLHDAAYSDAATAAELLLLGGARVDARAASGATPLCFAAQEDAPRTAKVLLAAGANPIVRCGTEELHSSRFSGYTPLHYCAHYNAAAAARVLLAEGTPPHIDDLAGRLPIHVAVGRGSSDVLRELLSAGAQLDYCRGAPLPFVSHSMVALQLGQQLSSMSGEDVLNYENVRLGRFAAVANESNNINANALINPAHAESLRQRRPRTGRLGLPQIITMNRDNRHNRNDDQSDVDSIAAVTFNSTHPIDLAVEPMEATNILLASPISSPVLRNMIPREPINSSKPWNCLSQKSIDECAHLLNAAEGHWSPDVHHLFSPRDRRAVLELLRVGKRFEQEGTGLFLDLWPIVLSFCGRGWFDPDEPRMQLSTSSSQHYYEFYEGVHSVPWPQIDVEEETRF